LHIIGIMVVQIQTWKTSRKKGWHMFTSLAQLMFGDLHPPSQGQPVPREDLGHRPFRSRYPCKFSKQNFNIETKS
jgi:hypothetical protein